LIGARDSSRENLKLPPTEWDWEIRRGLYSCAFRNSRTEMKCVGKIVEKVESMMKGCCPSAVRVVTRDVKIGDWVGVGARAFEFGVRGADEDLD
jgi:hypothetical protein